MILRDLEHALHATPSTGVWGWGNNVLWSYVTSSTLYMRHPQHLTGCEHLPVVSNTLLVPRSEHFRVTSTLSSNIYLAPFWSTLKKYIPKELASKHSGKRDLSETIYTALSGNAMCPRMISWNSLAPWQRRASEKQWTYSLFKHMGTENTWKHTFPPM